MKTEQYVLNDKGIVTMKFDAADHVGNQMLHACQGRIKNTMEIYLRCGDFETVDKLLKLAIPIQKALETVDIRPEGDDNG